MTKLNLNDQVLNVSPTPRLDFLRRHPKSTPYLIVLIPGPEVDLSVMARRIWDLANASDAHILFLGLYSDPVQELSLRRELVTLSAVVSDDRVSAEACVMFGNDWVNVVKAYFRAGDTVVCFAEQRTGLSGKPLSQVLQSELDVPLYILSGLYPGRDSRSSLFSQIAIWAGFIVFMLGFSLLQINIDRLVQGWQQTVLLSLSVLFECWTIWGWSNRFSEHIGK